MLALVTLRTCKPMLLPVSKLPASSLMPSAGWRIRKWLCGFCGHPLALDDSCTPCDVALRLGTQLLSTPSTTWCKNVSAPSPGCTWSLLSGSKPHVVLAMLDLAFASPGSMPRQLTWRLLVPVFYNVANWMVATGWTSLPMWRLLCRTSTPLPPDKQFAVPAALTQSQKELSRALDEAAWTNQLAHASAVGKATLHSEAAPGAGGFLSCVPSGRTRMEPLVFIAELRVRLNVPEASADTWCPRCDAVLDTHGYHSGMCSAGGERTLRHNALRDLVFQWCERGCLRPERERPGLLLPQQPDDLSAARRRPADVFLPSFQGRPTAIDFAVTAPQRLDVLGAPGSYTPAAAAAAYSEHKRKHLDTEAVCRAQNVHFLPLVVETTGAWAPEAAKALSRIGRASALHGFGAGSATLLQEACVVVRSWRARAALRRRAELQP